MIGSKRMRKAIALVASVAAVAALSTTSSLLGSNAPVAQAAPVVSTDWMANAGYGVALHWTGQSVPSSGGSPAAFCTAVNNFDVNLLANQLKAAGAGYVLFTMGHAQMYLPFPNSTLDGVISGRTCTRDLPLDMYHALAPLGIKMMFYFPSIAVNDDPAWQTASQWSTNPTNFQTLQQNIVTEIGNRYGSKLAGWWIDNQFSNGAASSSYATALRSGFSQRDIAFNYSSIGTWNSSAGAGIEDYQAGESNDLSRLPASQYSGEGGTQWQTFSYLDDFWVHSAAGTPTPRYSDNKIALYAKSVINGRGVLTLNAAPYQDTLISSATMAQLQVLKSAVRDAPGDSVIVDDRSSNVTYSPGWSQASADSYFLNSGTYTLYSGATASYTFTGTKVTWYGPKGPDHGRANVSIDGGAATMVDLYASSRQDVATLFTSGALSAGTHTVTITVRSDKNSASTNTYVELDALESQTGVRTDDSASSVSYSSGWSGSTIAAAYGGSTHYTSTPGSQATFTFSGTNATWYSVKGPDHGKADVSVDGGTAQTVDLYQSQWTANTAVFSVSGLSAGTHTLRVTARSDKNPAASNTFVEVDGYQQKF